MKLFKVLMAVLVAIALFQTPAMAAQAKAKYKKTTGQVLSANQTSIVVKGRAKQPLTVAINAGTEIVGAKSVKAGDTAAVNYRSDPNGNTATKISVTAQASEKPAAATAPKAN